MRNLMVKGLVALVLVTVTLNAQAGTPTGEGVVVRVQENGSGFDVYAELTVAATSEQTWDVLVDYDRMGAILSNVDASRIVKREGTQLEVAQTTHLGPGPFTVSVKSRRRVELIPQREIRSRLIEGDLQASDFTTRLLDEGTLTRVSWQGRVVPGPLAGLVITADTVEIELRRLCEELRAEILRRNGQRPSPCRLAQSCK